METYMFSTRLSLWFRLKPILKRIVVFTFIFVCFVYVFFPNKILTAYLLTEIEVAMTKANLPVNISMESANLYWFTGVKFKNISISNRYNSRENELKIPTLTLRMSILPLLIARAHLNSKIELTSGSSKISVSAPISELLNSNLDSIKANIDFNEFQLNDISKLYFDIAKSSTSSFMQILSPIISKTTLKGLLNGTIQIDKDSNTNQGFIDLNFDKLFYRLNDPTLNLPIQHFKKATIDIVWNNGVYQIKDNTGFESENLFFKPYGDIEVKSIGATPGPVLNLDVLLILSGSLEKNFGFLIPQLLKCPKGAMTGGVMNVKLVGPVSQYVCH